MSNKHTLPSERKRTRLKVGTMLYNHINRSFWQGYDLLQIDLFHALIVVVTVVKEKEYLNRQNELHYPHKESPKEHIFHL